MLRICLIGFFIVFVNAFPNNGYKEVTNETIEETHLFDTHQAILNEGYQAETHRVITHDGYILEVTRIPHAIGQTNNDPARPVVFLMHGLLSAASSFIAMGSQHSIAYHLVDAGFDVWMGNARGNAYSRRHVSLDPDGEEDKFEFFDFSFEEIGMYDVAAMIDYVLEKTGMEKLHYIGHSQGGTSFLVLTTMRPEYNEKIKAAHLLAAVGYQDYFPNREISMIARFTDTIYAVARLQGLVEFYINNTRNLEGRRFTDADFCFGDIKYKELCYLVGAEELLRDRPDLESLQAGAALKQIAHYGQNIRDKMFRRWHHGFFRNVEIYGTRDPPVYDLNLISTYVTMHYSLNDILLDERDVLAMVNDMPRAKTHKVARESFLHEDYIFSVDAKEMVTDFVIKDILNIEAGQPLVIDEIGEIMVGTKQGTTIFEDWIKVEEDEENTDGSDTEQDGVSDIEDIGVSDDQDEDVSENEEVNDDEDKENIANEELDHSQVTSPDVPVSSSGVTINTYFLVYLITSSLKLFLLR